MVHIYIYIYSTRNFAWLEIRIAFGSLVSCRWSRQGTVGDNEIKSRDKEMLRELDNAE